jgi:hypothetical protein
MHFALSAAYQWGQWQAGEFTGGSSREPPEYIVALGGAPELPLPCGLDDVPWCESVLGELRGLKPGLCVEWELRPDTGVPAVELDLRSPTESPTKQAGIMTNVERALKDRQETRRLGPRWRVRGRIRTRPRESHRDIAARVAHLLEAASLLDGGNRLVCRPARSPFTKLRSEPVLSEAELVGLFPPLGTSTLNSSPADSLGRTRLWLGRDLRGSSMGLPIEADQGRHLLVLGETGMGKSSMVVRLAWQAARWGSVILFDPVGDTAREFLAGLPGSRNLPVDRFSPSSTGLSLSLLREISVGSVDRVSSRERLLGDVVAALKRVRAGRYVESSFWGPRLEEMLFQALRAASYWPGASLAVAEQLLTPEGFPGRMVPAEAKDPVSDVRRRIEHFPQEGDGARRLLSEITRSEVLRDLLDSPSPNWSVGTAVCPGRTTVVSGDAPQVGESVARYLLAVVLALAWNAVLVRERPWKTFLILDEAQWYAHDSVAEMLRLGRRFNLHVWAVTQSLRSLPDVVRDAFATNSADLVLFRGDPSDCRDISRWVPQIAPDRIMRMPRGEAAVLIDKGGETHWVRFPPPPLGKAARYDFRLSVPEAVAGRFAEETPSITKPPFASDSHGSFPTQLSEAPPIVEVLRVLVSRSDGHSDIKIYLAELRAQCPGDATIAERWVRDAGRFLSSSRTLLQTGRDRVGSYWILSGERLAKVLSTGFRPTEPPARMGESLQHSGDEGHAEAN